MTKLISLARLMILFLVFVSFKLCESGDKSNKISIDDFPMTVGSQWTYLRTDSLGFYFQGRPEFVVKSETITVQITKTDKTKKKEIISEWVRTFKADVDTQHVIFRKDTLEFMTSENPTGSPFNFKIAFPIKVGNRWYGWYHEPPTDSYKVIQEESLEVVAGKFGQVYLIERGTFMPNSLGNYKCWIVPKVGIVKIRKWNRYFSRYEAENWELIKYDIKE